MKPMSLLANAKKPHTNYNSHTVPELDQTCQYSISPRKFPFYPTPTVIQIQMEIHCTSIQYVKLYAVQ